jgi:hypothetical protein
VTIHLLALVLCCVRFLVTFHCVVTDMLPIRSSTSSCATSKKVFVLKAQMANSPKPVARRPTESLRRGWKSNPSNSLPHLRHGWSGSTIKSSQSQCILFFTSLSMRLTRGLSGAAKSVESDIDDSVSDGSYDGWVFRPSAANALAAAPPPAHIRVGTAALPTQASLSRRTLCAACSPRHRCNEEMPHKLRPVRLWSTLLPPLLWMGISLT